VSVQEPQTIAKVAELKRIFDQTFAEAPRSDPSPEDDLLAISVGSDPYAIRLSEVAGLLSDRKVTWLPGSVPELIGLMGLRGALVPVYDLRALLGYGRGTVPRWFLIAGATQVALAFDRFDGHLRVSRAAVSTGSFHNAPTQLPCVHEVVRTHEFVRPIIHMPAVLDAIAVLVRQPPGRKGND
jgi:purine-binding chemotaxis protein CheW